jgi:hypothetical protein
MSSPPPVIPPSIVPVPAVAATLGPNHTNFQTELCLNCGREMADQFCGHCGQKKARRVTASHLLHDVVHFFTDFDGRFGNTLRDLLKGPGKLALNYVQGQRQRYFAPMSFLLFCLATSLIIIKLNLEEGFSKQGNFANKEIEHATLFAQKVLVENLQIFILLSIPLVALFTQLLFRKSRYSYGEHLVLQAYYSGFIALISLPIYATSYYNSDYYQIMNTVILLLLFVVTVWTLRGFFKINWWTSIWKSAAYLTVSTLVVTISLAVGIIGMVMYEKRQGHLPGKKGDVRLDFSFPVNK